jgi:hypothetical protein
MLWSLRQRRAPCGDTGAPRVCNDRALAALGPDLDRIQASGTNPGSITTKPGTCDSTIALAALAPGSVLSGSVRWSCSRGEVDRP